MVEIPNLCAIGFEESFSAYLCTLLDPGLPPETLLLQNHSKITITAAAAMPPTVPPTMVPVDGFEPELTGSAIGCPVGWLPPGRPLSRRSPGDVLINVGKAPMPPVEIGVGEVTSITVLEGILLSIESLSGTVGADTDVGVVAEVGAEIAAESGVESETELDAGIGVEAGVEMGVFGTPASPDGDTAGFTGWLGATCDCP